MKLWWAARGVLSLLLVLLRPPVSLAQAVDPNTAIDAYEAARNRGDWDGALAVFADDAVVTDSTGGVHTGKDEIRRMMMIQMGGNRGRYAAVTDRHVSGSNEVSWVERVATPTSRFSYVVDATVKDGRITALTYAASSGQLRAPAVAEGEGRLPAPLSLGVVLLVLAGALVSLSLPPRRQRQSPPRGWLVPEMRRWSQARQHPAA